MGHFAELGDGLFAVFELRRFRAGKHRRREFRGIAGDFTVFKCASAAAEAGLDLRGVVRAAEAANAATRLGRNGDVT